MKPTKEEKFDLSDQYIVIKDTYVGGYNMKEGMELVRKGDYYYVTGYLIKLNRSFINSSRTKEKPKQEEKHPGITTAEYLHFFTESSKKSFLEEKPKKIEKLDITQTEMYVKAPERMRDGVITVVIQRKLNDIIDAINVLANKK